DIIGRVQPLKIMFRSKIRNLFIGDSCFGFQIKTCNRKNFCSLGFLCLLKNPDLNIRVKLLEKFIHIPSTRKKFIVADSSHIFTGKKLACFPSYSQTLSKSLISKYVEIWCIKLQEEFIYIDGSLEKANLNKGCHDKYLYKLNRAKCIQNFAQL